LGVTDISGCRTSIAQIVAEELCLGLDQVHVISADTDTAPWASLSVGSMTLYSVSFAAVEACRDVKEQLSVRAAEKLGVSASEIEFCDGRFRVMSEPDQNISFAELAKATTARFAGIGPVLGRGGVSGLTASPTLSVHVVDLSVDPATGKAKIQSYMAAHDVGRAVNPMSVKGQIQGGIAQGIGWALMEQYVFKEGLLQNADLLNYRMPTSLDVPEIEILLVEEASSHGIYGMKHVGEPPMIPTLAAIANAISRSVGTRFTALPLTPETIFNAIRRGD
jgi:CO/xanthine dehydrogenase Mo-binding subunit